MTTQFPEHEKGKLSTNPKVQKLDKLARLLKVQIKIDGIPYGSFDPAPMENENIITSNEVVEKYTSGDTDTDTDTANKTNTETETAKPAPAQKKKRGRPKKSETTTWKIQN